MSVLEREALEASPLADLHAIASELSIDGYRRLRRAELIDAILGSGEGGSPAQASPARRRRGRRGGRADTTGAREAEGAADVPDEAPETHEEPPPAKEDELVEGAVELLPNGSGFIRVEPPEPSDNDVYISAAQVKRCELVSGDRVTGPRRAPRRSERFASLVRIDTVNGSPVEEMAGMARFEDLPAAFPTERLRLESDDATVKAIDSAAPIGRGSRVTIVGGHGAGKSEALRRLAEAASADAALQVTVALAGVRPEEISEWKAGPIAPSTALSFDASAEAQGHAVELVVEQARRLAARGSDAVVLIDTLDALPTATARKAMAAARNIVDGGSLTVIATASQRLGGETTVITLDDTRASTSRFPALDIVRSRTLRAEQLVGEEGAAEIERARLEASGT